jgi:hypothetical protein
LFLPFILILAYILFYLSFLVNRIPDFYKPLFIGIVTMSVHFYFITAVVNVFAWFLIGLISSTISPDRDEN